ncbi:MAG TPA: hypothetical protein VK573_12440 [Gemmatimonadales bacterium]|nr:hypothetical protein [Gemmatimonadales bacterium]
MPTFARRVVMLASGTEENVMVGSIYEYLPWFADVEIGIAADANGVLATINSGSDTLAEEQPVVFKAINVQPVYPDDFLWADEAAAGDRLKIKLRDTSAAARTVMVIVRLTPIG